MKTIEIVTKENIEEAFGENVSQAEEFIKSQYLPYPEKPKQPLIKQGMSSTELKEAALKQEQYEIDIVKYKEEKEKYQEHKNNLESILIDYIKEVSGLNKIVPEQYRDKVWSKAYSDGHSSGYYDVYINLNELVAIFE